MKKILIMLLLLFLCGMISGDIIVGDLKEENVVLGMEVYKNYAYSKREFETVFWQILFERCKCLIFVVILALTPLRSKLPLVLVGIFTFTMGFFTMSNLISLGAVGLLVSLSIFLPQLIFYGGTIFAFYRGQEIRRFRQGEKLIFHALSFVLALLLFVAGCVVECLIGVHFIPWMIRLSLI